MEGLSSSPRLGSIYGLNISTISQMYSKQNIQVVFRSRVEDNKATEADKAFAFSTHKTEYDIFNTCYENYGYIKSVRNSLLVLFSLRIAIVGGR